MNIEKLIIKNQNKEKQNTYIKIKIKKLTFKLFCFFFQIELMLKIKIFDAIFLLEILILLNNTKCLLFLYPAIKYCQLKMKWINSDHVFTFNTSTIEFLIDSDNTFDCVSNTFHTIDSIILLSSQNESTYTSQNGISTI